MLSPTSVDFLPRRLNSIAVSPSPKKKRIKTTPPSHSVPVSEPPPVDANLQNLPSVLIAKVLVFLVPNISRPVHSECGLINLAQVSKRYRALALDDVAWKRICKARWKTKVGFASRMAKAEAEAKADDTDTLITGSFWYRKFGIEERDAARTTIALSELHDITFSVRRWFRAPSYPPEIEKVRGIYPSGLDGHSLSDNVRFQADGTVTGLPRKYDEQAFFEMDKKGSFVNLGMPINLGTHRSWTLCIHRRPDWGWELRSQTYVMRSLSHDNTGDKDVIDKLWSDYSSNLVVEYRKKGVVCARGKKKYTRREVPDEPELMEFLVW